MFAQLNVTIDVKYDKQLFPLSMSTIVRSSILLHTHILIFCIITVLSLQPACIFIWPSANNSKPCTVGITHLPFFIALDSKTSLTNGTNNNLEWQNMRASWREWCVRPISKTRSKISHNQLNKYTVKMGAMSSQSQSLFLSFRAPEFLSSSVILYTVPSICTVVMVIGSMIPHLWSRPVGLTQTSLCSLICFLIALGRQVSRQ